jgi:hypothetical protein
MAGLFGPAGQTNAASATHAVVVNLDYKAEVTLGLRTNGRLEVFDATSRKWSPAQGEKLEFKLPGGGGKLLRRR